MPSRKGKGRQSLGFGRKSQRAQFHQEWQTRLDEEYYAKRREERRQLQRRQQEQEQQQQRAKVSLLHTNNPLGGSHNNNNKALQNSLRRLIAERQYWDRLEDRAWIYSHSTSTSTSSIVSTNIRRQTQPQQSSPNAKTSVTSSTGTTPPGWLVFHTTETERDWEEGPAAVSSFAREFLYNPTTTTTTAATKTTNVTTVPTLQALSLRALAAALPDYLEALGRDQLHTDLALLTGPALTVLSVLGSKHLTTTATTTMTLKDLCHVVGRNSHVKRLALVAHPNNNNNNNSNNNIDKDEQDFNSVLSCLLPHTSTTEFVPPTHVPDSWEEWLEEDDDNHESNHHGDNYDHRHYGTIVTDSPSPSLSSSRWFKGCQQLERLELGNMPLLDVDVLQQVLKCCHHRLTHLGLAGCFTSDRGPDVLWQLPEWVPHLKVLDVSGNHTWITEPLLRSVYDSYRALRQPPRNKQQSTPSQSNNRQEQQQDETKNNPDSVIVIKATGCLTRSSQILLEMEYGTLF